MTDILLSVPSDDPKLPSWVEVPAAQVTGIPDSPDDIGAATAEQGARADSAVQPTDAAPSRVEGSPTCLLPKRDCTLPPLGISGWGQLRYRRGRICDRLLTVRDPEYRGS